MIRHGEIPSNINKVYAGRSSEGLTENGVQQAIDVSERLKEYEVEALYSSPIQRALQTAQIIGEKVGLVPKVEESFREIEMGPWESMSEADVEEKYPDEWDIWCNRPADLKMEGRETLQDLLSRVLEGIRSIKDGDDIVIVTHVAIIRVMLLWQAKKSLNLYKTIHVPNAGIFEFRIDKRQLLEAAT
jgi:alpha-ribazole phosphatase/probable phosphoglycerate mutase